MFYYVMLKNSFMYVSFLMMGKNCHVPGRDTN